MSEVSSKEFTTEVLLAGIDRDATTPEWIKSVARGFSNLHTEGQERERQLRKTLEEVVDTTVSLIEGYTSGDGEAQSRLQRKFLQLIEDAGMGDKVPPALKKSLKEAPVFDSQREFQINGPRGIAQVVGIDWFLGDFALGRVQSLKIGEKTPIKTATGSLWEVTRIK